jgi:hypothetical protein
MWVLPNCWIPREGFGQHSRKRMWREVVEMRGMQKMWNLATGKGLESSKSK